MAYAGVGDTSLFIALQNKQWDLAEILLNNDVDITSGNVDYEQFLPICVKENKIKLVKLLLKHGVNSNILDSDGNTLLTVALQNQLWLMAECLLESEDDQVYNCETYERFLPVCVRQNEVTLVELLLENGLNPNIVDSDGNNLLAFALKKRLWEMAITLLLNGADHNLHNVCYEYVLPILVKEDKSDLVNVLIKKGRNVNMLDTDGNTLLTIALKNRSLEMTRMLLLNGADFKWGHVSYEYLLPILVKENELCLVDILIKNGLNANVLDTDGNTLLTVALHNQLWQMAQCLLECGADVAWGNVNYTKFLCFCVSEGEVGLVEQLLKSGLNSNVWEFGNVLSDAFHTDMNLREPSIRLCCKLLIKYFLLENAFLPKPNIIENDIYSAYWDKCIGELCKMSRHALFNTHINVRSYICYKSENKLAHVFYSINSTHSPRTYFYNICRKYDIFDYIILEKLELGMKRYYWLSLFKTIMVHSDLTTKLNFDFVAKVGRYLSNADIQKLVVHCRTILPTINADH